MISSQSSFASSMPATSANVTLFCDSFSMRALDLPKLIALPPEACIWRMKKKKSATNTTSGMTDDQMATDATLMPSFAV